MSDNSAQDLKQQRNRTVRLLTYFSIAAIVMMFGGLISAVYVSYKDKFWVNLELPDAFLYSTIVIVLSSLLFHLSLKWAKSDQIKKSIFAVVGTLILGVTFIVFQLQGYVQMIETGNRVKGNIFYQQGAYGDKFTLAKNNQIINFDGIHYTIDGVALSTEEEQAIKSFLLPICKDDKGFKGEEYTLANYGNPYSILLVSTGEVNKPIEAKSTKLYLEQREMVEAELRALFYFAFGVVNDMPFFMMKGEYGKDFTISLNGEDLEFENRRLYFPPFELSQEEIESIEAEFYENGTDYKVKNGKITALGKEVSLTNFVARFSLPKGIDIKVENGKWIQMRQELTPGQYNEFFQAGNNASSYLYVITALHALHVLLAIAMLFVVTYRASKGYYSSNNTNGLEAANIFWHFLGILWIFLYLFWVTITI
jgi:cytochrome c oxidase subunit III